MSLKELWTEKYRPKIISEYVFRDDAQKRQVTSWIDSGSIPHLLFSGAPGTGKTTLAKLLLHELDADWGDVLEINASRENSVDTIREKVINFASTMPFGEFKYIILDEADYMTPNAQAVLRGTMEQYANTVRFLLTCNYPNKILPALHSRCQGFHIEKLDIDAFTYRLATILLSEEIDMDIDTVDTYVKATYPDLRKCINVCQMNSQTGTLLSPSAGETDSKDWMTGVVDLFKQGKIREGRVMVCTHIRPDEFEDMFKFMYRNLELWSDDEDKQNEAILIIRDGLVKHAMVADPEINLSATLVSLEMLK